MMRNQVDDQRTNVGKLLRTYRLAAIVDGSNVTQAKLVELLQRKPVYIGTDESRISRWENGRSGLPTRENLIDIAQVLELPEEQRDRLLIAAGYISEEQQNVLGALQEIKSDTHGIQSQLNELGHEVQQVYHQLSDYVNPLAKPYTPTDLVSILNNVNNV